MSIITVENHGPFIVASSYWGSEYELGGKLWCSCNAGCIRVLVPRGRRPVIEEMRTAKEVILSRGPWPEMRLPEAIELLFDDGSSNPFALQLSSKSFDLLPAEPEPGQEWTLAVWDFKKGHPHQAMQRVCHWRLVARIPCLKPWGE